MAVAAPWRPGRDPLSLYLASIGTDADAEEELHLKSSEEESAAAAVADADDDAAEEAGSSPSTQQKVDTRWWARWAGRLARHGILVAATPPSPSQQLQQPPEAHQQRLLQSVLAYQLTLRAAVRQLQGPLALLCGRGVAVPMPPLAALAASAVEAEAEAEAERQCPALPALRAALVGSMARAAAGLVQEQGAAADGLDPDPVLESLMALARGSQVGLLQVQAAAQAWAALAGGVLGAEWGRLDVGGAVALLEGERALVAAAFRLPEEEVDVPELEQVDGPSATKPVEEERVARVRGQLRAMGRWAALGRAQAESLLARLFLRQCAVAEALRGLESADVDVDGVVASLLLVHEEDPMVDALLRAVGVDVRGEAYAMRAVLGGEMEEGGKVEDGVGWAASIPEVLTCGEDGDEDGDGESRGGGEAPALVFGSGSGRGSSNGHSNSPITSVDEDEDEDVMEVFESTTAAVAVAGGGGADDSPGGRRGREDPGQDYHQGALLLGELSCVLAGRERRRQERGRGLVVKVNGQRVSAAAPVTVERVPATEQPMAVPTTQGAAALAAAVAAGGALHLQAALTQRLGRRPGQQEEQVFGE